MLQFFYRPVCNYKSVNTGLFFKSLVATIAVSFNALVLIFTYKYNALKLTNIRVLNSMTHFTNDC